MGSTSCLDTMRSSVLLLVIAISCVTSQNLKLDSSAVLQGKEFDDPFWFLKKVVAVEKLKSSDEVRFLLEELGVSEGCQRALVAQTLGALSVFSGGEWALQSEYTAAKHLTAFLVQRLPRRTDYA